MEAKRQKEENRDLIGHRDAEVGNDESDTNATAGQLDFACGF